MCLFIVNLNIVELIHLIYQVPLKNQHQDITLVGKDPSFEPVITFSINRSNKVTAVSENLKQETISLFPIDKNIDVIPNFICLDDYKMINNDYYKKRYAPNNEKIICHISNFRKVKRIEDALKVFDQVSKKINAKFILVGDGPDRNKLERLARNSPYFENIYFLGNLKSTKEILNISDLFILPSSKESFGLAALEAMACGVPVVASNSGGIPEVVSNGLSGLLNDVGDVKKMAQNAIEILSNEETLKKYKSGALNSAKRFDINNILPLYEKLYESCVKNHLIN